VGIDELSNPVERLFVRPASGIACPSGPAAMKKGDAASDAPFSQLRGDTTSPGLFAPQSILNTAYGVLHFAGGLIGFAFAL